MGVGPRSCSAVSLLLNDKSRENSSFPPSPPSPSFTRGAVKRFTSNQDRAKSLTRLIGERVRTVISSLFLLFIFEFIIHSLFFITIFFYNTDSYFETLFLHLHLLLLLFSNLSSSFLTRRFVCLIYVMLQEKRFSISFLFPFPYFFHFDFFSFLFFQTGLAL